MAQPSLRLVLANGNSDGLLSNGADIGSAKGYLTEDFTKAVNAKFRVPSSEYQKQSQTLATEEPAYTRLSEAAIEKIALLFSSLPSPTTSATDLILGGNHATTAETAKIFFSERL